MQYCLLFLTDTSCYVQFVALVQGMLDSRVVAPKDDTQGLNVIGEDESIFVSEEEIQAYSPVVE